MKKLSLLILPLIAFTGCDENGAAREAVDAPSDYVGANVRAQQQAQVTSATSTVNSAIRMFAATEGRNPRDLNELRDEGYLERLPDLPRDASFDYNPQTGELGVTGY